MRKYLVLLLALVMVLTLQSGVYAAEGDEISTTSFRVDGNGEMWYQVLNEAPTTNDTVTAAESGKVFLVNDGGAYPEILFNLPAADEGLTYTFVQQGTTTRFVLNPNGTDQLLYSTASAGNRIKAPATAGSTATIYASDDTVWFVTTNATFTIGVD